MIFRRGRVGPRIAESVNPATVSSVGRTLSGGALAAACACCATGLLAPPAAMVVPQNPSVWSQPDPAAKFGLPGGALLNGLGLAALAVTAGTSRPMHQRLDAAAAAIEPKMIGWRRDFHQHPELGNQEVRTASIVARHLRSLGYDVRENIAVTGIVATLQARLASNMRARVRACGIEMGGTTHRDSSQ